MTTRRSDRVSRYAVDSDNLTSILIRPLSRADAVRLARLMQAVADATRLQILNLLACTPGMSAVELEHNLTLSQPTISHHMAILTTANVVIVTKVHRYHVYYLNRTTLDRVVRALGGKVR